MSNTLKHNTERNRFETTVEGQLCVADYHLVDGVMVMTHTLVPRSVAGRGIAASLVSRQASGVGCSLALEAHCGVAPPRHSYGYGEEARLALRSESGAINRHLRLDATPVAAALDHVRKINLKVDPQCSYVRNYMRRHPETQSLHV